MTSIHKLTGVTNNSSKKGEVGEYMLDQVITQRYGDLIIENKAKTPHSGDAWLTFPDGKKIMLESKNYNYRVNKDELDKMENDMITNYMKFGIFISWCSTVQNRKDLDIHTFPSILADIRENIWKSTNIRGLHFFILSQLSRTT